MAKILVIEDNEDFLETVTEALKTELHSVEATTNGADGLHRLKNLFFDIAIIDWDLPGISGMEICKQYRTHRDATTLILMLTGKSSSEDIEMGLKAGADDYLGKPCSMRELLARVRSLLRRAGTAPQTQVLKFDNLVVDPTAITANLNDTPVSLSKKEFALLVHFLKNPQRVYGIDSLLKEVWYDVTDATEATVRTHIKTLRKKIDSEEKPSVVETVHGVGYRLRQD